MPVATELYQARNFTESLNIAHDLGAKAIALGFENTLTCSAGNYALMTRQHEAFQSRGPAEDVLKVDMARNRHISYGMVTNSTNPPLYGIIQGSGFATTFANILRLPLFHKGMLTSSGVALPGMPKPDMLLAFCDFFDVQPEDSVLIDNRPMTTAGAAVTSHFKAVISAPPIGEVGEAARTARHPVTALSRRVEERVLSSYIRGGLFGKTVMRHYSAKGLAFGLTGEA